MSNSAVSYEDYQDVPLLRKRRFFYLCLVLFYILPIMFFPPLFVFGLIPIFILLTGNIYWSEDDELQCLPKWKKFFMLLTLVLLFSRNVILVVSAVQ